MRQSVTDHLLVKQLELWAVTAFWISR